MEEGEYTTLESPDSQEDEAPVSVTAQHDIVFSAADPRYIEQTDNANGGDITSTVNEVRRILECEGDITSIHSVCGSHHGRWAGR
jgi:hypothetical protein